MKKLLIIPLLFMLTACQKFIDKIYHKDPASKLCQLLSITTVESEDAYRQNFYYNKAGNPDSIVYDDPGTGHASLYFFYDKKGKLIRLQDNDVGEYRYSYDLGIEMPARDTLYDYYGTVWLHRYTYDALGRIVKVKSEWLASTNPELPGPLEGSEWTYVYNPSGNLYATSDTKINYWRTNRVLQFLNRDYSVNNRNAAVRYNAYGFPEKFEYASTGLPAEVLSQELKYSCK